MILTRLIFIVCLLTQVAFADGSCHDDFLRLVDHLVAHGNRLTTNDLSLLAAAPAELNPAELLNVVDSAKQAWRKAFAATMVAPGFKWGAMRDALKVRATAATGETQKRDVVRDSTTAVMTPVLLAEMGPEVTSLHMVTRPINRFGDTLYLPNFPNGSFILDIPTFTLTTSPISGAVFQVGRNRFTLEGRRWTNIKTSRERHLWSSNHSEGPGFAEFAGRNVIFANSAQSIHVRSVDRGKKISYELKLHSNFSDAVAAERKGGKKRIAFYDGRSLILSDPLGTDVKIPLRLGAAPSAPAFYDGGRRAVIATMFGFHFVDVANKKEVEFLPIPRRLLIMRPPPVKIFENAGRLLGVSRSTRGVAIVDMREQKLLAEAPSPIATSEIATFLHDGETFLVWGDEHGGVNIADLSGAIISRNQVRTGQVSAVIPFVAEGKIKAIVVGKAPPALIQLYGPIGEEPR